MQAPPEASVPPECDNAVVEIAGREVQLTCTSAAIGELAASLIGGERPSWIDPESVGLRRLAPAASAIPSDGP